jgi:hypothetical protein
MRGSVYIIGPDVEGELLKIGFCEGESHWRLKQMQPHPGPLRMIYDRQHDRPHLVEGVTHEILRPHRIHHEWFDVSVGKAILAIAEAVSRVDRNEGLDCLPFHLARHMHEVREVRRTGALRTCQRASSYEHAARLAFATTGGAPAVAA